jgi:small subunit ribosomal protein S16
MSVKLRLTRMGKKKQPFYRIIAVEETKPRESRYADQIGYYNPMNKEEFKVDEEKALKWLGNGATPTSTVKYLLSKSGIMKKFAESKSKKAE